MSYAIQRQLLLLLATCTAATATTTAAGASCCCYLLPLLRLRVTRTSFCSAAVSMIENQRTNRPTETSCAAIITKSDTSMQWCYYCLILQYIYSLSLLLELELPSTPISFRVSAAFSAWRSDLLRSLLPTTTTTSRSCFLHSPEHYGQLSFGASKLELVVRSRHHRRC